MQSPMALLSYACMWPLRQTAEVLALVLQLLLLLPSIPPALQKGLWFRGLNYQGLRVSGLRCRVGRLNVAQCVVFTDYGFPDRTWV